MTKTTWRDTLFVWDGIMTTTTTTQQNEREDSSSLKWEGTWVGCENAPDATTVEPPKRGAFDEFVTSEMKFSVEGTTKKVDKEYYQASLTQGEGWDLVGEDDEKKKHQDEEHDLWLKNLKWSGNLQDQRDNLVFGRGKNEQHGNFIAAGWMRPGNRLTLARRYLVEQDARTEWTLEQLKEAVLNEVYDAQLNKARIPPWQCNALHAKQHEGTKKRQATEEAEGVPEPKKQEKEETAEPAKEATSTAADS